MALTTAGLERLYERVLARRWLALLAILAVTGGLGVFAAEVKPDYSIEMIFPRFDQSRVDYERFKKDFPYEDAYAVVIVQAPDLYTPAGLGRIAALEADLARVPGVVDTQGLTTTKDLVSDGDALRMERIFPATDLPPEEIAARRQTATTDPLYRWTLATPDGSATTVRVTLTKEVARKEETRTKFLHEARAVISRHQDAAKAAGVPQKIVLNGLPVIRSEFTEMVGRDLGRLFPLALVVILVLLGFTFRSVADVGAALVTILVAVVWSTGAMGLMGVSLQVLTQVMPIVVLIVSISDTVHIVAHSREGAAAGAGRDRAIAHATADSFVPCLLTEITIAGGFASLVLNDMVMIQQFGVVTAVGMLLTWLANVTVLPIALSFFRRQRVSAAPSSSGIAHRAIRGLVSWVERVVTTRPRTVFAVAGVITMAAAILGSRAGKQYYSYDDLRPEAPLTANLRLTEKVNGGTVPLAIYIEPKNGQRVPDAMLEPEALRLMDRIGTYLETRYPDDVKNAQSLAKVMRKAHRLLAGDELAAESPLPKTRRLAAQELLAIDDPRTLRDILSFDRSTAAVFMMVPDHGSAKATHVLADLRRTFDQEQAQTGYRVTITGIYGIADGIYRSLVGGLARSLALAVLISFGIFFLVLRSWRLALIALVPNLLPLLMTAGLMTLLHIDIKPSTVVFFSITLVIADDDTIQFLSRFRRRFKELQAQGVADPHRDAALDILRESGLPMFVTAGAVTIGFLSLLASEFLGLANLGLLIGVSLMCAVFADLFLTPLLIMKLRPRL